MAVSCRQDDYLLYDDVSAIHFGADTIQSKTFFYDEAEKASDTLYFTVQTIGNLSGSDRSLELEQVQVEGVENAVPGKHFVAFNGHSGDQAAVVKAGTVENKIPVVLLRDPSLKESTVVLRFRLKENREFRTGEPARLHAQVTFTETLSRPAAWNTTAESAYYGIYSFEKHKFMIEATGQKWDQSFMNGLPSRYSELQFWTNKIKMALLAYNQAHPGFPLVDEHKQLIVFP